jgi:phosphoglycolate phosphatase-like HAD superfamily hydrolase
MPRQPLSDSLLITPRKCGSATRSLIVLALLLAVSPAFGDDGALSSWNDTSTKQAIVSFVERVATEGGDDYVTSEERIAVFDNDGTLWCEQPMYFQLLFALDRVRALADEHPEWQTQQPFAAVIANDRAAMASFGHEELGAIVTATHAGMTTDEFDTIAREWLQTARHPVYDRPYTECVYQPMLELLDYLRANGFKTYIVSGGGIDFIRAFAEEVYGISPEQVIGSSGKTQFEMRDGVPVLVKLPEIGSIDDGPGKPVNIELHIGRRPVMAFGNSDGDLQMLQWTTAGEGARFGLIVHHTDGDREVAYDRESHIGELDVALDEAATRGWTVVDMRADWRTVFAVDTE